MAKVKINHVAQRCATLAEMMRSFCVLAFCVASYKRANKK